MLIISASQNQSMGMEAAESVQHNEHNVLPLKCTLSKDGKSYVKYVYHKKKSRINVAKK